MDVKRIIETIKARMGGISSYKLSKLTGISAQVLSHWERKNATTVKLEYLARLRKASGLDWKQFGKLIDGEFGE